MRIWIDASRAGTAERLFGLDPVERHRRALRRHVVDPSHFTVDFDMGPVGWRVKAALLAAEGPLLVVDGASAVDPRLTQFLFRTAEPRAAFGGEGPGRAAILVLTPDIVNSIPEDAASVLELGDRLVSAGAIARLSQPEFPSFIANLRRSVDFWLFALPDAETRRAKEFWLFRSNYKGSTDFLTRWVYPPVVWPLVRFSVRAGIHPNWITALSVVIAFAVVPLFAAGQWLPAFALAFLMTILDSVDGKVARLTLTDSALGNVMDHGLDIVHPPLWYFAWAWGLGARAPSDPLFVASVWLVGFYVADRIVLGIAKARFGRGLHAVTALDGAVRTWIARRNVNMAILCVALLAGHGPAGFLAVTLWQGLTFVWHAWRTFWLARSDRHWAEGQA